MRYGSHASMMLIAVKPYNFLLCHWWLYCWYS